jgi:hypothetical protein
MSNNRNNNSLRDKLLWPIVGAVIAGVILLYLQYQTRLFERPTEIPSSPSSQVMAQATTATPTGAPPPTTIPTDTIRSVEADTPLPSTPTQTQVPPAPTIDRHPGEVNLLESDKILPSGWFTNGQYTYWEGFLHVQDEPFIDITVADCGDDEGNGRLDIVQIFNPDGTLAVNDRNCNGNPKYRVRTYQKSGHYRIFLQDNDTGGRNGNGGTLSVDMLKDQTIYKNLP